MVKYKKGQFMDEILKQLVEEHNIMEKILKDILPIVTKDHPELIFKYMEYFKKDESHLNNLPTDVEDVDIF